MEKANFIHSVILDYGKCKGCTTCIRSCPTEAIRVHNGKARIRKELCIDCGECIRLCPYKAKKAVYDHFNEQTKKYKWSVALPPPALYGQFSQLIDVNYVLQGLINMGFDDVFEVSRAAELVSEYTRRIIAKGAFKKPLINSSCPVVVKLIKTRYPELWDNVLPVISPVKLAARMARDEASKKTGYKPEEIGIFFLSPCPAKVAEGKNYSTDIRPDLDGIFSISEIYLPLLKEMNKLKEPQKLSQSGIVGYQWAISGGESGALDCDKYLAADGIQNVINVLEEIERDRLIRVDYAELNACSGGCVGGVLTVENPFIAKTRIVKLCKENSPFDTTFRDEYIDKYSMQYHEEIDYEPVTRLDKDFVAAMKKMQEIEKLQNSFPGLDCGACGAPNCRALAEDVVRGLADAQDCLFMKRINEK